MDTKSFIEKAKDTLEIHSGGNWFIEEDGKSISTFLGFVDPIFNGNSKSNEQILFGDALREIKNHSDSIASWSGGSIANEDTPEADNRYERLTVSISSTGAEVSAKSELYTLEYLEQLAAVVKGPMKQFRDDARSASLPKHAVREYLNSDMPTGSVKLDIPERGGGWARGVSSEDD